MKSDLKNLSVLFAALCAFAFNAGFAQTLIAPASKFQILGGWEVSRYLGEEFLLGASAQAKAYTGVSLKEGGKYTVWARASDNPQNGQGTRTFKIYIDGVCAGVAGKHGKDGFAWEKLGTLDLAAGAHILQLEKTGGFARASAIILAKDSSFDGSAAAAKGAYAFDNLPLKEIWENNFPQTPEFASGAPKVVYTIQNADCKISFAQRAQVGGKSYFVRSAEVLKDDKWIKLPPFENELFFLQYSKDIKADDNSYFVSWSDGSSLSMKTRLEAGGKTLEAPFVVANPYRAGAVLPLRITDVKILNAHSASLALEGGASAVISLPQKGQAAHLKISAPASADGFYSIGVLGFNSVKKDDVKASFLPAIYQAKRLMSAPRMVSATVTSQPLAFFELSDGALDYCVGVSADPKQMPFEWSAHGAALYGFSLSDIAGAPQPAAWSPVMGLKDSRKKAGETVAASFYLMNMAGDWRDALEYFNTQIFEGDYFREAYGTSLSDALCNMAVYLKDVKHSGFSVEDKARWNIEVNNLVALAAPLAEVSAAILANDEEHYRSVALPTIEYTLSRRSRHYAPLPDSAWANNGYGKNLYELQCPSPSWGPDYYYSLNTLLGGLNPWLKSLAKMPKASASDAKYTSVPAWAVKLACYIADNDSASLEEIKKECDAWLEVTFNRQHSNEIDFEQFVNIGFYPYWWNLPDLYELTGDKKYLDYAQKGAFYTISSLWNFPTPPDGEIVINRDNLVKKQNDHDYAFGQMRLRLGFEQSILAEKYMSKKGVKISPPSYFLEEKSVDAHKVSRVGLGIEQHTTCVGACANIIMPSWANEMLRVYAHTGRDVINKFSRHSIIGRFANFPGYYINTFTDVQFDEDYPYKGPDMTALYYHHAPCQFGQTCDYLMTQFEIASAGKIKFPYVRQQGYAWFTDRIYGPHGAVFNDEDCALILEKGAVTTGNPKISSVIARGKNSIWVLLINDGAQDAEVSVSFNPQARAMSGAKFFEDVAAFDGGGKKLEQVFTFLGDKKINIPAQKVAAFKIAAETRLDPPALKPLGEDAHFCLKDIAKGWGDLNAFRIRSPFGKDSFYAFFTGGFGVKDIKMVLELETAGKTMTFTRSHYPYEISVYPIDSALDAALKIYLFEGGKKIFESPKIEMKK